MGAQPLAVNSAGYRFVQWLTFLDPFLVGIASWKSALSASRGSTDREEIEESFELIRPKLVKFVQDGAILIDSEALQAWAHPRPRRKQRRR
jgi:hypothetical protein